MQRDGDLPHVAAHPLRANDELAREQVAVDDAGPRHVDEALALEGLEPVRIGAAKSGDDPQEQGDGARGQPAHQRSTVVRAFHRLGPDDHVGALLEDRERALVELHVAEIDLVADHHLAARLQDPDLQRTPVVGVVFVQPARPRKLRRQRLEDLQRAVARAVLGEDQLVLPAERVELAAELGGGFPHDARLVVDGDDDRNHARLRAASRPERRASSIELYSHFP